MENNKVSEDAKDGNPITPDAGKNAGSSSSSSSSLVFDYAQEQVQNDDNMTQSVELEGSIRKVARYSESQ